MVGSGELHCHGLRALSRNRTLQEDMPLTRPAAIQWKFRMPPEPFPQTPSANGVFQVPDGMGKTTTLISMLLGPCDGVFDQVHVFSPSVDIDSAWLPVKERASSMEGSSFQSECV